MEKYSKSAINNYNSLFYSSVKDAFLEGQLADFFVKIDAISLAFAKKIEKLIPKDQVRVLELGTGSHFSRWEAIRNEETKKKWEVVLTDFTLNSLPKVIKSTSQFSFKAKKLDVLKPFPKNSVDVVLTTYGFDSVWFPEDIHLERKDGKWYEGRYKFEVSGKRKKMILEALAKGRSLGLFLTDFENISIRKKLFPTDLSQVKYKKQIEEYYPAGDIKINFPGGLLAKVDEAFEKMIAPGGVFITGDMAVNSKKGVIPKNNYMGEVEMKDYMTSGKVAKFKVEDYGLAKKILEKKGYRVELVTVEEFIAKSGQEIPLRVVDHLVMVVKRTSLGG